MESALTDLVWLRAGSRCEYCLTPQVALDATLHIEHIVAQQHFGRTTAENLALACQQCNLFKGPNLASVDPQTGEVVLLYHPRRDRWQKHFELSNSFILGLSPAGRATAQLLNFNSVHRRRLRARLLRLGEIVPPSY